MDFINSLVTWIETFNDWGYLIVFCLSFLEVIAFIGLLIPGTLFLIFVGFLTASGYLNFWLCLVVGVMGATFGDIVSFILGKKITLILKGNNRIFYSKPFIRCKNFLDNHGGKGVFWGRFIGPIRPFVPFVAGLGQMSARKYFFWGGLGSIGWAFFYLGLGYFCGQSLASVGKWFIRIGTVIFVSLVIFIGYWMIKLCQKKRKH